MDEEIGSRVIEQVEAEDKGQAGKLIQRIYASNIICNYPAQLYNVLELFNKINFFHLYIISP